MVPQKKRPIVFPFGTTAGGSARLSQFFGLKEKILIGRRRFAAPHGTEGRFQIAGDLQRALRIFRIFQRQMAQKRPVQRIDEHPQDDFDLQPFIGEDRLRRFKPNGFGNRGRAKIPEAAAPVLPQVQPGTGGKGAVLVKTGQHQSVSGQITAALRIDEPGGTSAAQQMRIDGKAQSAGLPGHHGGAFLRFRPSAPQRTAKRAPAPAGLFLQEQPVGLRLWQIAEQTDNILVAQQIAQSNQNHALMAARVAADNLKSAALLLLRKIGRLKESHGAFHAHGFQPKQILKAAPQIQRQGENRGIGRDYAGRRIRAQSQRRQAESLVQIIEFRVEGMIAAFTDAINAARPIGLLFPQGGFQGGGQQRTRNGRMEQKGRQVFGQGAVAGKQTLPPAGAHSGTAQPVPVPQGNLTGHDGIKAEQPRFAGQQRIMRAILVRLVGMNTAPEKPRIFIKKSSEVYPACQRVRPEGKVMEALRQRRQQRPQPLCADSQADGQKPAVR